MPSTQVRPQVDSVTKIVSKLGKYNLLPQLQREIIIDDAISPIKCTSDEVETAYQKIIKTTNNNTESDLAASCRHFGDRAKKQVIDAIIRKLKIEKFKQETWGQEISSYFISQKKRLDKVVYSEIVHPDEGVATEIYFRLLANEQSFIELAFEYLQSEDRGSYHVYDPIRVCPLNSQMAQMLIKHQPGAVLRPIHCRNVYHVMRLEKIIPAVLNKSMHCQLLDELFEAWLERGCNESHYRKLMLRQLTSWTA